jgi:hypothetical protein
MIDKNIIVTGIKFRDWTISANVILTFEYDRNTNKFHHKQSSIGVNDGDIVGQGNNAAIPNISFSNHASVDAVRWAKMTADAGMNIGQRDDWIDAIYESDALRDAIADEAAYMSADYFAVREIDRLRQENETLRSLISDEAADEFERLRKERDEARRMYCEAINRHHVRLDAFGIAKNHGWDCYKEEAK